MENLKLIIFPIKFEIFLCYCLKPFFKKIIIFITFFFFMRFVTKTLLIRVQLVSLDFGPQGVINKIYNLLHHELGQQRQSYYNIVVLGSFIGMGFHFTIDINSKLNQCLFISRLALKEHINLSWKRFDFKLTTNSN